MPSGYGEQEWIVKAKGVHSHNGKPLYDYSKVQYKGSGIKVIIICPEHGEFTKLPFHHMAGKGCPACAKTSADKSKSYGLAGFIKKAKEVHGDKYDYSLTHYINGTTNVLVICPKEDHGGFLTLPVRHLNYAHGCVKCGYEVVSKKLRDSKEEFIEKAGKVHGDKYDYSGSAYVDSKTPIEITCLVNPLHGAFRKVPTEHTYGYGCPKCSAAGYSRPALEWVEYRGRSLGYHFVQHAENEGEFTVPGTSLRADGYIKELNMILEFHGDYWHGNPCRFLADDINKHVNKSFGELYVNTIKKRELILSLGYKYEEIWESDWLQQREAALAEYPPYESEHPEMLSVEDDEEFQAMLEEVMKKLRNAI